jgi:hypothetical protein
LIPLLALRDEYSDNFLKWIHLLSRLIATFNPGLANPSKLVFDQILKNKQAKKKVCKSLVRFELSSQDNLLFVCLEYLNQIAKEEEPQDDFTEVSHQIEVLAFLCLTSTSPYLRTIAFKCLKHVNKFILGRGIYLEIESRFSAITSNALHNFKLPFLPDRPGNSTFSKESITFKHVLTCSSYRLWYFFFSRNWKTSHHPP